jgi:hypothetical protein
LYPSQKPEFSLPFEPKWLSNNVVLARKNFSIANELITTNNRNAITFWLFH